MHPFANPIFRRLVETLEDHDRVLQMSIQGISQLAKSAPLAEALSDLEKLYTAQGEAGRWEQVDVEEAKLVAGFAQKELDRGFPILHAHSIVSLWGVLEAFVEDLVIAYLNARPSLLDSPNLSNIKIALAEYEQLEKVERLRYLLAEFARTSKADLKQGVSRFEILLDVVGLSGAVEDDVKHSIFELGQVRNVIVHRGGIADRRVATSCPWLHLAIGETVIITHSMYTRHRKAIDQYLAKLVERIVIAERVAGEQSKL